MSRYLPLAVVAAFVFGGGSLVTGDPWADDVIDYSPGNEVGTAYLWESNANPEAALGAPEYIAEGGSGLFVSLGAYGSVELGFSDNVIVDGSGNDLAVVEVGSMEPAAVYVSSDDGATYTDIDATGSISGTNTVGDDIYIYTVTFYDLATVGLASANAVRIVDLWGWLSPDYGSSGFDLDAVEALNSADPPIPDDEDPPVVTAEADRTVIWPPNHKTVTVTVSTITITDESEIVDVYVRVEDEYGELTGDCETTLNGGIYTALVDLIAWRDGGDKDGRTYTLTVWAEDEHGNLGSSESMTVLVPHDQGKKKGKK